MLVGKQLGPYTIEKELGSGAMGTVFRARHKPSDERVALKLLSPALGKHELALARFEREIKILKQLDHPNIVKYRTSGRYHGTPFYIMEYVEGESLDRVLERRERLPWEEVIDIGMQLCAALQHAHDKGIIHRDLKPSNLMVLRDGTVKLTDFGIAKDIDVTALTGANSTVGTAAYMSPEQCHGLRDISPKSDLYSMGIMFYELVTGRKPFVGDSVMELFLQHTKKTDYRRPSQLVMDVPIWLDALICQLMAKDPDMRPFSAEKVAAVLSTIKDKVEEQKSAAIEAAKKRRVDRTGSDIPLDEKDREAARTMLGKKKKKKAPAFYTRGWFTVTALATLLIAFSVFMYFAVFRTPAPETLYSRAEALVTTGSEESRKEAREGPIADFLRAYPGHEKAKQVKTWADEYDRDVLDRQMINRSKETLRFEAGPEEQLFRQALKEEDRGKLSDAAKLWEQLRMKKNSADSELHLWGLLAEKYLQEIRKANETYGKLKLAVQKEELLKEKPSEDLDPGALDAVRAERSKNFTTARNRWEDLKANTKAARHWHLLAASRLHELRDAAIAKPPSEP